MIRDAIRIVVENRDLSPAQMKAAFTEIMAGKAEPAQISAFITALRMKKETVDEITAAAKVMREINATRFPSRCPVSISPTKNKNIPSTQTATVITLIFSYLVLIIIGSKINT